MRRVEGGERVLLPVQGATDKQPSPDVETAETPLGPSRFSVKEATTPAPSIGALAKSRKKKKTEQVVAIDDKPLVVREIRRAGPEDAEAIAAIQSRLELGKLDAADHPQNGWLLQMATPEAIRFSMIHYKDYWVAVGPVGEVLAYQTVSAPRYISRPAEKHRFFGPHADRAYELIREGTFIYMSQIAIAPSGRGHGIGSYLQKKVLEHYRDLPLVAHVGVFLQADFDAWDGKGAFDAKSNNVASHRFHQKHNYVPVAWTSDLARTDTFNSGVPPSDEGPGVLGVLYIDFRDGTRVDEYIDPVTAVLNAPMDPSERDSSPWRNPFPYAWPDKEIDVSFDEGMFIPNPVLLKWHLLERDNTELFHLRRR